MLIDNRMFLISHASGWRFINSNSRWDLRQLLLYVPCRVASVLAWHPCCFSCWRSALLCARLQRQSDVDVRLTLIDLPAFLSVHVDANFLALAALIPAIFWWRKHFPSGFPVTYLYLMCTYRADSLHPCDVFVYVAHLPSGFLPAHDAVVEVTQNVHLAEERAQLRQDGVATTTILFVITVRYHEAHLRMRSVISKQRKYFSTALCFSWYLRGVEE